MTRQFRSQKYGVFLVTRNRSKIGKKEKNYFCIWWDFYDEHDGCIIDQNTDESWITENDVNDFTDAPKNGEFISFEAAHEYIVKKFGVVTEE